jgi:N utilization substance protein A
VEEVAFVPLEDLTEIEGFDEDLATELRERAQVFLAARDEEFSRRQLELGVTEDLANVDGLKPAVVVALGEKGIKTLDDLADLSGDELMEIAPPGTMTRERADEIIMSARAHWFEKDDEAARLLETDTSGSGKE